MSKAPRLRNLRPRVTTLDTRTAKPLPKTADDHYSTAEHRAWAKEVKDRAGWRCEHIENGHRCEKRHPSFVMYADHILDVKDRPDLALNPANGRCACNSHNTRSGIAARAARLCR